MPCSRAAITIQEQAVMQSDDFKKKLRDDQGYWEQLESYLDRHSDVKFSHGICQDCMKKHYPEFCDERHRGEGGPFP